MTREQLIKNGVKNLKEFGYPDCDEKNILKPGVLREFFQAMLEDNVGKDKETDETINKLLIEIS